ncbi:hypothetical protein HDU97_007149 [Phlyctochytrium planicorne]|nr:hypothetical protein HDU97_007149 [Phlyctochytrium planicorne]
MTAYDISDEESWSVVNLKKSGNLNKGDVEGKGVPKGNEGKTDLAMNVKSFIYTLSDKTKLKITLRKKSQRKAKGRYIVHTLVKNLTDHTIAVRLIGNFVTNSIIRDDFHEDYVYAAFDADPGMERNDTVCVTCFRAIQLWRKGDDWQPFQVLDTYKDIQLAICTGGFNVVELEWASVQAYQHWKDIEPELEETLTITNSTDKPLQSDTAYMTQSSRHATDWVRYVVTMPKGKVVITASKIPNVWSDEVGTVRTIIRNKTSWPIAARFEGVDGCNVTCLENSMQTKGTETRFDTNVNGERECRLSKGCFDFVQLWMRPEDLSDWYFVAERGVINLSEILRDRIQKDGFNKVELEWVVGNVDF